MITQAVHAELTEFLNRYEDVTDSLGRRQVVRNGYLSQREIVLFFDLSWGSSVD